MIAMTLLLFAFHMMGWIYFVAALLLNAMFLARALKLWRLPRNGQGAGEAPVQVLAVVSGAVVLGDDS